ncbi:hypothetical protein OAF64_02485 [Crocinitomicaceae bacterium]|jgi:hypothetical protein|nr:hypothetical protein [Crocinitomicaceae bacterium]
MKKSLLLLLLIFFSIGSFAQGNSSIAVANPNVDGLYATPDMCAKMIRLELSKLNKYSVYDVFDMQEIYDQDESYKTCLSKTCLVEFGGKLGVDYMITGSYDLLGNKIAISLKMIDVKNNSVYKSGLKEFTNQEKELQRMTEVLIKEMLDIPAGKELVEQLRFDNDIITKSNVGKVSNSGPRVGLGIMTGSFYEYAMRSEQQGGLDIFPAVSMIGYQLEAQYVGTNNFSALAEFILNVSGLEQGQFLPTLSILNGFRFGDAGWEFAFGPGFTLSRTLRGSFDSNNNWESESEWNNYWSSEFDYDETSSISYNQQVIAHGNDPVNVAKLAGMEDWMHNDGAVRVSTMFLMAFGRTFKAGALNIPVNIFYSSRKGGGIAGVNVGFNVTKSKTTIKTGL